MSIDDWNFSMFNDNLRLLRERRGLYQKDLAELLGIIQNSYSKYELGKAEPSIANLIKLADFFDVTLDELVDRPPTRSGKVEGEESLLLYYRGLSPEDRERVLEIAKAFYNLKQKK